MSGCDQESDALKILRVVSYEKSFHFSSKEGVYTGITATCLEDFASKLDIANVDSVIFHYGRGDFQYWIQDTIGDRKLANQFSSVNTGLPGDQLKKQLTNMLHKRIAELKSLEWIETKGI